jgi:RNA polymerase-binding transcription factor DksA
MSGIFPEEDECKFKDPIDQGSYMAQMHNDHSVAAARLKAAPEQDGTVTECVACGDDIEPERIALRRARCFTCQETKERKESRGLG